MLSAVIAPHVAAHGIGGRQDLPIPLTGVLIGASVALVVSFVVLAFAVQRPFTTSGRALRLPRLGRLVDSTGWRVFGRVLGLVLAFVTVWTSVTGPDDDTNAFFGIFYIWIWVGLVPASFLLGPVWRWLSPTRTLTDGLRRLLGEPDGLYEYPPRLGYWLAAVGLWLYAWMELVYPHNADLGPVRLWFAVYVAASIVGGLLLGPEFHDSADPFERYSTVIAGLSPWGRDATGQLVLRSPLSSLEGVKPHRGLTGVMAVLFGTIAYDSFRGSIPWLSLTQNNGFVRHHDWGAQAIDYLSLLVYPAVVGGLYALGTMLTPVSAAPDPVPELAPAADSPSPLRGSDRGAGPAPGSGAADTILRRRDLPGWIAPSLIPIITGYVLAHYLSYLWEGGQATLFAVIHQFGGPKATPNYFFAYHPTLLAVLKVAFVVVGHVLGVVSAHSRAIAVLPARRRLTGQLPLLVVMIAFTVAGLYFLFAA